MRGEIKEIFVVLTVVLAIVVFCPRVYGQEAAPRGSATAKESLPKEDKLQMEVIPYFWAAGLRGDVTVKGVQADLNLSFTDLLKYIDFGGMAHGEIRKGDWGIFMDGMYMNLSTSGDVVGQRVGPVSGDVKITMAVAELGGLYRVAKWDLEADRKVSLDVLGGGRYWYLQGNVGLAAPNLNFYVDNTQSKDWIDPFVGLRLNANLTKDLVFQARGDIGGFGVGSDFSWNLSGVFGYTFTPLLTAYVGYRALAVDYRSGSALNQFKFDVTMYGPVMGLGFRF